LKTYAVENYILHQMRQQNGSVELDHLVGGLFSVSSIAASLAALRDQGKIKRIIEIRTSDKKEVVFTCAELMEIPIVYVERESVVRVTPSQIDIMYELI